jgi:hypothetical protein
MAGQAGWYRAPGEDGLLRYWNGSAWTEHRQPVPVTVEAVAPVAPVAPPAPVAPAPTLQVSFDPPIFSTPQVSADPTILSTSQVSLDPSILATPQAMPVEAPAAQRHLATDPLQPQPAVVVQASEPDWSMDQFEKQFEAQFGGSSELDRAADTDPYAATGFSSESDLAADPYATPVSRFAPQPSAVAPTPVQVQSAPAAPVAAAASAVPAGAPAAATGQQAKQSTADIAFAASHATADVERVKRNRKRVQNPVRGMIVGLLFILVGVALIFISTAQNNPPSGELKANGIITSLGSPKVGCSPVARFAAAGGSYTTAPGAAISPCPVGLGQAVNVFYTVSHPGTTGTISSPSSISTIDWAVTGIGVLLVIGSGILFIARAGSVSRGVAVIRDGELAEVAAAKNRP